MGRPNRRGVTLCGLFDSSYESEARGFSVQKVRMQYPNMFRKIEWAKRVATIYMREWRNGECNGAKREGFSSPYPTMPPEKHQAQNQQEARSRGGLQRAKGRENFHWGRWKESGLGGE